MRVRLIRKLSEEIDGVDLLQHRVGDTLDLAPREAQLLIAEGWGRLDRRSERCRSTIVLAFRRAIDPGRIHDDELDDHLLAS